MYMFCKFVAKKHRLSMLHMREPDCGRIRIFLSFGYKCLLQLNDLLSCCQHCIHRIEAKIGSDLIIARTTGAK